MSNTVDPSFDLGKRIDAKLKLLDYHRKAMESRRTLSYQAFLGLLGFYFVLFQAIEKLIPLIDPSLEHLLRWVMTVVVIAAFTLFLAFSWQVEVRNAGDRKKYSHLEKDLWDSVVSTPIDDQISTADLVRRSWATTWPLLTLFVLSIALLAVIWTYSHKPPTAASVPSQPLPVPGVALLITALALGVKAFLDVREFAVSKLRSQLVSAICFGVAAITLVVAGTLYIRG